MEPKACLLRGSGIDLQWEFLAEEGQGPTMRIVNGTRSTTLASEAEAATTFWRRLVGLLGRRSLAPGQGLVLQPCRSVHTAFMRFPIDVVYVDRSLRVVKVVGCLAPFRVSAAFAAAHAVIELPCGTVAESGTVVGDSLTLED